MTDEKYVFITDCAEKKRTARGIHNKRTHTGKGGKVKFPSDYLTRKEREQMNGEVKNYSLGKPMSWKIYKLLPNEIKREYLTSLMEKHGGGQKDIAQMFGVSCETIRVEARRYNINFPQGTGNNSRKGIERQEKWQAFLQAKDAQEEAKAVAEEADECVIEDKDIDTAEITFEEVPVVQEIAEMPKEPTTVKKKEVKNVLPISCSPKNGTLTFEGAMTTDSLNLLFMILPKTVGKLTVTWEL